MNTREWAEIVLESLNDQALFMDRFDAAIVGVTDTRVVYGEQQVVDIIMTDGATEEEAWDHYAHNICGSIQDDPNYPIIIRTPPDVVREAAGTTTQLERQLPHHQEDDEQER